jgi:hypothetical protein
MQELQSGRGPAGGAAVDWSCVWGSTAPHSADSHIWSNPEQHSVTVLRTDRIWLVTGQAARLPSGLLTHRLKRHDCLPASAPLAASDGNQLPRRLRIHQRPASLDGDGTPWPIPQSRWAGSVQNDPAPSAPPRPWWTGNASQSYGYQAYGTPPLTPEQQIQRCNTGRLIGGLGGGAVAYAMSRDDGRAWAIPLGALLGSQVGCNAAAGRGPLPW